MPIFSASISVPSPCQMRFCVARMRKNFHIALFFLFALPFTTAIEATVGYSVNSDGGDFFHQLNLESGIAIPLGVELTANKDIEGLAIAPNSGPFTPGLWGMDEDKFTMFRLDPVTGLKVLGTDVGISGVGVPPGHDFGLTFSCDGTLYASSVTLQTLYTIAPNGAATIVGSLGNLGENISAIAAFGDNPTRLYGLSNGLTSVDDSVPDTRTLFDINLVTGITSAIGTGIGAAIKPYHQAGLSFDDGGKLWAITDRSALGQPSEILSISTATGVATLEATTVVLGFESLALSAPAGCNSSGFPDSNEFKGIPTLSDFGKLMAVLALMLSGAIGLRQRNF